MEMGIAITAVTMFGMLSLMLATVRSEEGPTGEATESVERERRTSRRAA